MLCFNLFVLQNRETQNKKHKTKTFPNDREVPALFRAALHRNPNENFLELHLDSGRSLRPSQSSTSGGTRRSLAVRAERDEEAGSRHPPPRRLRHLLLPPGTGVDPSFFSWFWFLICSGTESGLFSSMKAISPSKRRGTISPTSILLNLKPNVSLRPSWSIWTATERAKSSSPRMTLRFRWDYRLCVLLLLCWDRDLTLVGKKGSELSWSVPMFDPYIDNLLNFAVIHKYLYSRGLMRHCLFSHRTTNIKFRCFFILILSVVS